MSASRPPTVLIAGGTVVRGGVGTAVLPKADVWISGERISAITDAGQQPAPDGCEVIDASDAIVMPGLIDTHRHLWQTALRGMATDLVGAGAYRYQLRDILAPLYRPEDVYAATLAGALEALECGVTTVLDWAHIMNTPEHADASIAALRESGARAVFAHSAPQDDPPKWWSNSDRNHPEDVRRVRRILSADDAAVTMALGARAPHFLQRAVKIHDCRLARELGLRIVYDGNNPPGVFPVRMLAEDRLLGPDCVYVHANNLADDEYSLLAEAGAHISMAPFAEMLGGSMPATAKALEHGIRPAISIDLVTAVGGDLFETMRATLTGLRTWRGHVARQEGRTPESWDVTTADILDFATSCGAAALGMGDRIGSLAEGKLADIVLLDTRSLRLSPMNSPLGTIVLQATPADVDTVLVGGRVVKRKGELVAGDRDAVITSVIRSRDRLIAEGWSRLGPLVKERLQAAGTVPMNGATV